jgi:hypothetical protein
MRQFRILWRDQMKKIVLAFALSSLAPVFADTSSAPTTMRFDSIPVAEKVGAGEHKIYPYRSEDTVLVVVVDPIACGQKPVNPRFEVKGKSLILRYDLTKAPAGKTAACTAHSTFLLTPVPHSDLQVEFAGGTEPFHVAQMTRCPKTQPVFDIWDCLVPSP